MFLLYKICSKIYPVRKYYSFLFLFLGTGTNSCYVEKTENAELFEGDKSKQYVIINTESGAFGDDGKLDYVRTEFDKDVDQNSINPGRQL